MTRNEGGGGGKGGKGHNLGHGQDEVQGRRGWALDTPPTLQRRLKLGERQAADRDGLDLRVLVQYRLAVLAANARVLESTKRLQLSTSCPPVHGHATP